MAYLDKEKQRKAAREHYSRNKESIKKKSAENSKIHRIRNRDFVKEYLLKNPCVDCGNNDIRVLEFDHISNDKLHNVSNMIHSAFSIKKIQEEINKCHVRCANCHRVKTRETIW